MFKINLHRNYNHHTAYYEDLKMEQQEMVTYYLFEYFSMITSLRNMKASIYYSILVLIIFSNVPFNQ